MIKLDDYEKGTLEAEYDEGYNWIAKDGDSELCVYAVKPVWDKEYNIWRANYENDEFEYLQEVSGKFEFIEANENGIYNIKELLKGNK